MTYELIRVERDGALSRVFLDGQEVTGIPRGTDVTVDVNPDRVPTVRMTVMAERVEVVNDVASDLAPSSTEGGGHDGEAVSGDGGDLRDAAVESPPGGPPR